MNDNIKKELRRDSGINGLLLLIFWILYYIIDLVAPLAAKIFEKNTSSPQYSTIERLIFYIFMYPVGFTLILTLFRKINKGHDDKKLSSCFCKPRTSPGWTIKWIILTIGSAYAASFISNIIYMLFRLITGVTLAEATLTNDGGALGTFTIILPIMIFAPLFEEMFFRGTLYQNVRKYSGWSMMLISGLTFGLWHANFPQFLTASVMGVFSCFLIEKTGSIFPSMTVHFIINSIGSFTTILTSKVGITSQNIASQDIFTETMSKNPFTMIAIALIGLLIIIFLIIWLVLMIVEITCHPESFRIENRKNGISGGKAFIIYMTSPLMIITMLGMLALTVTRALGIWL